MPEASATHEDARDFWSLFGAIYCISLASRPDRRRTMVRRFAEVGIGNRFRFWDAIEDVDNPFRGCWDSHTSLMRHTYREGIDRLLVFEDDAQFTRLRTRADRRRVGAFLKGARWNALVLGCRPFSLRSTAVPGVHHCFSLASHATVLNLDYVRRIRDARYSGVLFRHGIDCLRLVSNCTYALVPMLCTQDDSYSDIERQRPRREDWLRRERICLAAAPSWENLALKAHLTVLWAWNRAVIRLHNPGLDLG
jgi:glycosyl transferase family 25